MSPRLRIPHGDRDVLLTIEGAVETIAPTGFAVETFEPLVPPSVWAQLVAPPLSGTRGEPFATDQLVERELLVWVLPYRPDCDPDRVDVLKLRRILYAGRVHDIVDAAVLGRRHQLKLTTRRVA